MQIVYLPLNLVDFALEGHDPGFLGGGCIPLFCLHQDQIFVLGHCHEHIWVQCFVLHPIILFIDNVRRKFLSKLVLYVSKR